MQACKHLENFIRIFLSEADAIVLNGHLLNQVLEQLLELSFITPDSWKCIDIEDRLFLLYA